MTQTEIAAIASPCSVLLLGSFRPQHSPHDDDVVRPCTQRVQLNHQCYASMQLQPTPFMFKLRNVSASA